MKYYHATTAAAAESIIADGKIKTGFDGVVYLGDSINNAAKFLLIRFTPGSEIIIFEIEGLDESKIEESFDHSEAFFKCKAWMYPEDIPTTLVTNVYTVE